MDANAYTYVTDIDISGLDDILNEYIYSRGIYTTSTLESTKDFASTVYTRLMEYVPDMVSTYATDMILQATLARESVLLAQAIVS